MNIVKCSCNFYDMEAKVDRKSGEEFEVSLPRLRELAAKGVVAPVRLDHRTKVKKSGAKVIIYQKLLYKIGGIETWDLQLAKTFKDRDITFVFSAADAIQMVAIAEFADVIIDNGTRHYDCDVLISANYDGGAVILDRVSAKKYYQTIHSDFQALKKSISGWQNFQLRLDNRFDKIISASETAQKGLQDEFGISSIVAHNPLAEAPEKHPVRFLTLSRASEEKGLPRMVEMARKFERANKDFVWFVCSTLDNARKSDINAIKSIPEMIIVQPNFYSQQLLRSADYLVQLSDTEAYCYSVHQALQMKVPVIATKFDEAKKVIKNGKNGYLLDFNLKNLDIDKIFNEIPECPEHTEKIDPVWTKILNGEL